MFSSLRRDFPVVAVLFMLILFATASAIQAAPLSLSGSVGQGGNNAVADVKKVQQRLRDLGFSWVAVDGDVGPITINAIKLFQSIKGGKQSIAGDGRVDVGGDTHKWLEASNAPRWQKMSASGEGYKNIELQETGDDHDFGTNWLDAFIKRTAKSYQQNYRSTHDSSLMTINDASRPQGGDTPDHKGHETGLSIDLRLPKKNHIGAAPGGRTFQSADYDRDAAKAILLAFRADAACNVDRIFFNDPALIQQGLCLASPGHDNHIHVEIKPPQRQ